MIGRFSIAHGFPVAHASRVWANASWPSRTLPRLVFTDETGRLTERLFRRDVETSTRDACAPQTTQSERQ